MHRLGFLSKIIVTLLISFLVLATACTGPAGPAGPAGPMGPVGQPGSGTGATIQIFSIAPLPAPAFACPVGSLVGSVQAGEYIYVLGSGFTPGDAITVVLVGAGTADVAPSTANLPEEVYKPHLPDYYLGNASVLKSGGFTMKPGGIFIPTIGNIPTDLKAGVYVVKATDWSGIVATCPLNVTAPAEK